MKNLEIAKILYAIADILELQEVQFKPRAYRNAARAVEILSEDIEEVYKKGKLQEIPGVGESIAEKIEECIKTGKLPYYEKLKREIRIDIESMENIPGLGPKKIKVLYHKLKIKNLKDLEKALEKNQIRKLAGFGEETEKNLKRGIELVKSHPKRFLYAHALPIINQIKNYFSKYSFIKNFEIAGSFRRGKETVGDLDFLAVSEQPEKVMEAFVKIPDVKDIITKGSTKSSIRLTNGLQIDLRVVKEEELGSALLYFIGNKEHNVAIRKLALFKGYTLNEYGLFNLKTKERIAGRTEQEIYDKLGLQYIEPEMRENMGELKLSQQHKLPTLVTDKDIKGIFHNHSRWSDGSNTLSEMVKKAKELKFKFLSFNDHFSNLGIVNPLNEKRLISYLKEIEKIQKNSSLKIFTGIEIDIQKDGTLAISNNLLKKIDVVIASVHTSLNLPEKEMTARICKALENYPIHILGHPTGIELNRRPAYEVNLEKVYETAKRRNVFLEINSLPSRMDLNGEKIKAAKEIGCKFALSTDAHNTLELGYSSFGVLCARRGWLEKKDLLNCWDFSKIEKALRK